MRAYREHMHVCQEEERRWLAAPVWLGPNPTRSILREPACPGAHDLPRSLQAIFFTHHQHFLPIIVVGFKILSCSSGRTPLICPFVWGFASSGDSVTGPSSMAMGKMLFTAHLCPPPVTSL